MSAFPEIWASPEPTVARIDSEVVRDQLVETGHERRESDLDRLASLGICATRYPVLWEKVAPDRPEMRDWAWSTRRLERLRELGIEPIVTLLHHGSGPRYTSLVDPAFPALFARYAGSVARRFPWVKRWTPINEPLTTARFSTLYGVWYPNGNFDHVAFAHAVVYQALAIAQAMQAIRSVIPDAQLLLTEDLQSFAAADREIAPYVRHKRERSFLSCELLMGRVVPGHELFHYLRDTGNVAASLLERLTHQPCSPDIMGFNYYPFSERILFSEGHGRHRNVALVEVDPSALDPRSLLVKAWERLGLPLALSEVHVIGDEDERARWMLQRFADVQALRARTVDIRALNAWAAFGMIDWVSLLRSRHDRVEDGVFTCARGDEQPRATRVAEVIRSLARGHVPDMPATPGWWERQSGTAVA